MVNSMRAGFLMLKVVKFIAVVTLFAVLATACGGEATPEPTVAPTAAPAEEPTERPTAEPTEAPAE
ncbi:MAG: PT domain-containing protein [Chloroflexota bacterium]